MTDVHFILVAEPPTIEVPGGRGDGVNKLFNDNGPFAVETRQRTGKAWTVTLTSDLNAGQKTALKAALEGTGYCAGVTFP